MFGVKLEIMDWREVKKKIKGVFVQPKLKMYLGRIKYGTPYFEPIGFCSAIIYLRKLKQRDKPLEKSYGHNGHNKYSNFPMVRRSKYWVINDWYIEVGWPVAVGSTRLGWKDKFESPRFEWPPAFYIFFLNLQFCLWWVSPDGDNDSYYEMILWYLEYADKDIVKAKETWWWVNCDTKKSTWNDKYLIKH